MVFKLTNYAASKVEVSTIDAHPKNPKVGKKSLTKSCTLLLEQDDAQLIDQNEEV